jgi:flavorubredoxin
MLTPITDDVTWLHECHDVDDGRHIHSSAYVVEGDDDALLVDTGDLHYREAVIDQIETATDGAGVGTVFVSKSHMPHSANVNALKAEWPDLEVVFPGGIPNVHGFPEIVQWPAFGRQELYGRDLGTTKGALLDIDHTVWLYDFDSGVFFTIDGFCAYHDPADCAKLTPGLDAAVSVRNIREFYQDILLWIEYADPDRIMANLHELVDAYEPTYIAPGHGNPIAAEDIPRYMDNLERALRDIADSYEYPDQVES